MLHWIARIGSTLLVVILALTGSASAQGTIKIMYTDPLSGPFAQVGDQNLQQFKYILDYINGRGGALGRKFELVSFDNKSQPSEALLALKAATDQNIPVIMQCSGSNIAAALIEGVDKHNERTRATASCTSTAGRWPPSSPTRSAASGISAWTPTWA